ncbi:Metallo-dependent phosphatase [Tothia fuscella]|uniref:Metallo-dependent phosphatase n=1 Tax=Tothia fuscella TaxID=1048955 RepID=A0A9P4TSA4_9PEZI|nr:Metallo-dependent phosphatase [Tothia fuscella]
MGKDGTFKISIFEDLHFGEAEDLDWGPAADIKSVKVMETLLDVEKPDLVVLNGDLITGENTYFHNATHYLDQIVQPMVQRKVPWASTYGNHDHQFNLSSSKLISREREKYGHLSLTRSMVSVHSDEGHAGISNYVLPIHSKSSTRQDTKNPVALLWFFDSKGGHQYRKLDKHQKEIELDGFVHPSVVTWFRRTNAVLNPNGDIPSLAFVHIPIFAAAAFQKQGVRKHKEPGINDDNPLSPQAIQNGEYTGEDVPFIRALAEIKGLKAVFSGHDHGDDWCFKWDSKLDGMNISGPGLSVCFGRHTGYGGYGTWTRGSRQILLREDTIFEEVETWIRLENEKISGRVMLNETYGQDRYPAVEEEVTPPGRSK